MLPRKEKPDHSPNEQDEAGSAARREPHAYQGRRKGKRYDEEGEDRFRPSR